MEITSPTSTTALAGQQSQETNSVISSDFETFLVMLTAQLENQDPLNPLDSQDFATQLATFSGVEQQVQTNDLLRGLSSQMVTSSLGDMAGWVGLDARVAEPVSFTGTPIELFGNPSAIADRAEMIVRDQNGSIVQTMPVPVTAEAVTWAGVDDNDAPLPNGQYNFTIAYYQGSELAQEVTPEAYVRVAEIRNNDGTVVVVDEAGEFYPASSVLGLRE